MTKGLSKAQLQIIAVIAMVMDHLAFAVSSYELYYGLQLIGRITIVIMAFFIAEGYYRTSNLNKYIVRMGIFAVISQLPFYLFNLNANNFPDSAIGFLAGLYSNRNVIFTLFIGLCLLTIIKSKRLGIIEKTLGFIAAMYITRSSDWSYFGVLWILGFGWFCGNKRAQMASGTAIVLLRFVMQAVKTVMGMTNGGAVYADDVVWTMVQLGGLLAVALLTMYNGEKGKSPKLGFYVFYPAHLLLLAAVKYFMLY